MTVFLIQITMSQPSALPKSKQLLLKSDGNLVIEYDYWTRNPKWVAEHLTSSSFSADAPAGTADRKKAKFHAEQSVPANFRVSPKDYINSQFDRGHLAAAANFTSSQEAMNDTFSMTNISPQNGSLNKSTWAKLEAWIRKLLKQDHFEEAVVVTGPVFAPQFVNNQWVMMHKTVGVFPKLITVPTHFFKVVKATRYIPVTPSSPSSSPSFVQQTAIAAFLVPNEPTEVEKPLSEHLVRLDQLELITGLSFFDEDVTVKAEHKKQLDDFVPSSRDMATVLNPIAQKYGNLLLQQTQEQQQLQQRKLTLLKKDSKHLYGVVHLCRLYDCGAHL